MAIATPLGIEVQHPIPGKYVEELWEHFVKPGLTRPTFVMDFPLDTSPLVRAAALEASVRAMGPAYLAQLIPRLGTEPEEEIQMALLAMIRSVGLPSATSTADDVQNQREGELALVYKVATEHPVDRVRVSAMATLGEISGSGFKSLREDEWQSWWLARTQPTAR